MDGKGNLCKSGGRVVKNVTGYDLHKLLIGSLGTLAAVTRLNFRTFPLPEVCAGHLSTFSDAGSAMDCRAALLKAGLPLNNLEVLSPEFSAMAAAWLKTTNQPVPESLFTKEWNVYAACEGVEAVVQRVTREMEGHASAARAKKVEILSGTNSENVSGYLREAYSSLVWASPSTVLIRIVLPYFTAGSVTEILQFLRGSSLHSAFALRACGVAYLALLAEGKDTATLEALNRETARVFSSVAEKHGTTTLLHAPLAVKRRAGVWSAKPPGFPLMQRVKAAFDPSNIFAPGRFVGGI